MFFGQSFFVVNMLLHIPQVLTPEQVAHGRRLLDSAPWISGAGTAGQQASQVKRNQQLPDDAAVARELSLVIQEALLRNPLFTSAALPLRVMAPKFNRYEGAGHYGDHVDASVMTSPGTGQRLRSDLSCTLFFSEPEDYDGGELVVSDTYGTHEVKLPAGDLILYPSTSLHRVEPVTRGARVSSFFWVQSMVRDDWQRTMLFELDKVIQKLRAVSGDNDETVALGAHYHNLIRMWGEV